MFSNENIKEYVLNDKNRANQYYEEIVSPMLQTRAYVTNADVNYYNELFPKLAQSSSYVSTDVKNTIEWALPSLMKIFFGSNDIVSIDPKEPEDARKAYIMKKLINYQLTRENNGFITFYNWFKDSYEFGLGVVKAYWIREKQTVTREEVFDNRRIEEVAQKVEIVSVEPYTEMTSKVRYNTQITTANKPKLENIMPSDFRFLPNYANLQACPFVAQIVYMTGSDLKQKEQEGVYANVDSISSTGTSTSLTGLNDPLRQYESDYFSGTYGADGSWVGDKSRIIYEVWECYGKYDVNDDGIAENVIITICGDTILRMEENTYGVLPFFTLSPMHEQYRIMPKSSYADWIKPVQDLKTAFHRLIVRNLAVANDPLTVVDPMGIEIQDVLDGNTVVRTRNNRNPRDSFVQMPPTQINPQTFSYLEMLEVEKENRTGVTRYSQGADAQQSLNKTATGITAIMQASNQRLELNARIFAETGIQDLFRHMIRMNQQYISNNMVLRLTNESLEISPDDLSGDFDLVVSAGVGIVSQEAMQRALQQDLAMVMQVAQMGVQIATPENIYNTVAKMLQELGIKDVSPYITNPQIIQQQQQQEQQAQQQQLQQILPELVQQILQELQQQATPEQIQQVQAHMQQTGQLPQEVAQLVLQRIQQMEQQGQVPQGATQMAQQQLGA